MISALPCILKVTGVPALKVVTESTIDTEKSGASFTISFF
jgi:hypothetical protein